MRFNEFNTINEDVLTEQELVVESALIDFLEDTITKEEFFTVCEQQGVTRDDLNEIIPAAALGIGRAAAPYALKYGKQAGNLISKGASKAGSFLKGLFSKGKDAIKNNPGTAAVVGGSAAIPMALQGGDKDAATAKPNQDQALGMLTDKPAPKKPEPKKEPSSFGKAFAAARKAHGGPGGVFTYKGKKYQTNIKGEKYVKNPTPVGGAPKPAQSAAQAQGGRAGGQGAELGAVKMPKGGGRGDGNVEVAARSKKAQRDAIKSKLQAKRQERDALIAKRAGQGYT